MSSLSDTNQGLRIEELLGVRRQLIRKAQSYLAVSQRSRADQPYFAGRLERFEIAVTVSFACFFDEQMVRSRAPLTGDRIADPEAVENQWFH